MHRFSRRNGSENFPVKGKLFKKISTIALRLRLFVVAVVVFYFVFVSFCSRIRCSFYCRRYR